MKKKTSLFVTKAANDFRLYVIDQMQKGAWDIEDAAIKDVTRQGFAFDRNGGAHAFVLPRNGLLADLGPNGVYSVPILPASQSRLPYPHISIEYLHETEDQGLIKTVLICSEIHDEKGVFIQIITMRWVANQFGLCDQVVRTRQYEDGGFSYDWIDLYDIKRDDLTGSSTNSLVRVWMLIAALSCANVKHERRPLSHRDRVGTVERDSYHVVKLRADESVPISPAAVRNTQTFESRGAPRAHWRRGHIRRLSSDRFTWVKAHMVNPQATARVSKHYLAQC